MAENLIYSRLRGEEQEVFITTRARPYPSNPVSKNKRNRRSESQKEEELRAPVQEEVTPPFISPIENSTLLQWKLKSKEKKEGSYFPRQLNS